MAEGVGQLPVAAGVLLAAGAGRRYGKPKVLVDEWRNAALTALRGGGCDAVIMVLGAAHVQLPDDVIAITASDWQAGLSASVRAGLRKADSIGAEYAVLHVIDTPDVGAPVVSRVLHRALASRSGLAQAYYGDRPGHPVVLARRHWREVIEGVTGDRGAGPFLRARDDVEIVDCADLATGIDHDEPDTGSNGLAKT
ncbi:nucleotidyltransferase family protein [Mycobacterium bourgelatii]|uniref:Molybdopterin-guanine dinucleotide biosynthesis protein MobA n=1 Tax=Mycobacterium bourgelatii TaxID=1273442 RepID=A0A7I9YSC7_MYCBU|nr:NTP transferase domain-containing protein [Mycobacterium bourgelatii]MCV6976999.1 NTP transferase domain-containing protein [Mycobacterium bourgelatii]GFG91600.1 molybdopterin-guanine dinucleotide biosynthesis protein MobA [Mycobacterium bourgelatii]